MNKKTKKVRKISPFLCQEMMFDYVTKTLDDDRTVAMKQFISENADAKTEMDATIGAIEYCSELNKTRLSEPMFQEISEYKSFWSQFADRYSWSNWPEYMRWATEALVLSVFMGVLFVSVPWKTVGRWVFPEQPSVALIEKNMEAEEDDAEPEVKPSEPPIVIAKTEIDKSKKKEVLPEKTVSEKEVKIAEEKKAEEKKKAEEQKKIEAANAVKQKVAPKLKGELYRSYMTVDNLEGTTAEVVEYIKGLGGKKAGKVQLGWPKPNSSYFHFSLPIANYDQFIQKLNTYGRLKIYKYPHGRIMPEGQRRIILEIKRNQSQEVESNQ